MTLPTVSADTWALVHMALTLLVFAVAFHFFGKARKQERYREEHGSERARYVPEVSLRRAGSFLLLVQFINLIIMSSRGGS